MSISTYRILFENLLAGTGREEIPVNSLQWGRLLDSPGALQGSVDMDHPKCTRSNLNPGATAVYVERGGLLVWGGILWTGRADSVTRQLTIGAEGFWSYFRRRILRTTKTYTAQDQLFMARDLINYALAQPGSLGNITVGSELTTDNGGTQQLRTQTYSQFERKNIGQAVEELAALKNGFDFEIAVAWDAAGTTPTRTFKLYYPMRGTRNSALVFNHNVTGVSSTVVEVDATKTTNLLDALGQGDATSMLIGTAVDTSGLSTYPLLEDTSPHKDVNDQTLLNAVAAGDLNRNRLPRETPILSKDATTWPDLGAFQEGDAGLFTVSDGWISVNSYQRIQGFTVNVGDEGQETMSLTVTNADLSA